MKYLHRLLAVASAAIFIASTAVAQNAGTVTNHAFAVGKGPGTQGFTSLICGSTQLPVGQSSADPICAALSGDVTMNASGVTAIGASKVTNAQIATMVANTTKCNATAGSANPTDCNASTMRTNIGVVIGTNVEAWDADLDCLAALGTQGVLKRVGLGTCSAGSLALSDLATGSQDTVIGYFGSTTASASAVPNCTGALNYSTSTHLFSCNTSGGTGSVTSVTCGTGLSGGTFTTTGTCALALNSSVLNTSPANPANVGSVSQVMEGLGVTTCRFTPTYSSRVKFEIIGNTSNNVAGQTNSIGLRYGTGVGPANGAAVTGTSLTNSISATSGTAGQQIPFSVKGIATALTPGTAVWFDMTVSVSANTATVANLTCIAEEAL